MKKSIILFGAGLSATCLIDYLLKECYENDWELTVADSNAKLAQSKIGNASHAKAIGILVEHETERNELVKSGDIVISLLPPSLHVLVAESCLSYGKHLLTASYLDEKIAAMEASINDKNVLFLCEMGLDPGIDHMSAMKMIHRIKMGGGKIISFQSHCGGLVAPESDDNPWHYKISWNPRNVVLAGSAGAVFMENHEIKNIAYQNLFEDCKQVNVKGIGTLSYYPNRDSLPYMAMYKLEDARTFVRTTLRYPAFCTAWNSLVQAGLTNDQTPVEPGGLTFKKWSEPIVPFINPFNADQLNYLGLSDNRLVPETSKTSADILQYLLQTKLQMQSKDKDMIVMLHQVEFEKETKRQSVESALIVIGESSAQTAMAKTVGLPLGIAASLILKEQILLRGLHIPVLPEIYEPVLQELEREGIVFKESGTEV